MDENKKGQADSWIVYAKTDKGVEEIQTRKYNLSQQLRTILIVINGKSTKGILLSQFAALPGVVEALESLERQGFIARNADFLPPGVLSPEEEKRRVQLAGTFMVNTLQDAVGSMGSSLIETLGT